jgi:hypothetical protein
MKIPERKIFESGTELKVVIVAPCKSLCATFGIPSPKKPAANCDPELRGRNLINGGGLF